LFSKEDKQRSIVIITSEQTSHGADYKNYGINMAIGTAYRLQPAAAGRSFVSGAVIRIPSGLVDGDGEGRGGDRARAGSRVAVEGVRCP
jgi:hypothetical protein